jgi:hypothetical protein
LVGTGPGLTGAAGENSFSFEFQFQRARRGPVPLAFLVHFVAAGHPVCALSGMEMAWLFHAMISVIRGEGGTTCDRRLKCLMNGK